MSGTSVDDLEEERADHEAGHFFAAVEFAPLYGIDFDHHWITIEPRVRSGGSCGIGWHTEPREALPPVDLYARHLLSGCAAQVIGAAKRLMKDGSLPEAEMAEFIERRMSQGGDDFDKLESHPDFNALDLREAIRDCYDLVRTEWFKIKSISKTVQKHRTLFGSEPQVILTAIDSSIPEQYRQSLIWYRKFRKEADPPKEWLNGATEEFPAGPWYEDFASWFKREGQRPDEYLEDWGRRLHEGRESAASEG